MSDSFGTGYRWQLRRIHFIGPVGQFGDQGIALDLTCSQMGQEARLWLDDDRLLGAVERCPVGCLNELRGELGDLDEGVAVLLAELEDLGSHHKALGVALADVFLDMDAERGSFLVKPLWRSGRCGSRFGIEHGLPLLDRGLETRSLAGPGREGHRHVPVAVNGANRLVALETVVVDGILRDSCQ